jgi:hypothetical protein
LYELKGGQERHTGMKAAPDHTKYLNWFSYCLVACRKEKDLIDSCKIAAARCLIPFHHL